MIKNKRISFSQYDAEHLYELSLEHLLITKDCFECNNIRARLEKIIGIQGIKRVKKNLRKNGYCNHLNVKI